MTNMTKNVLVFAFSELEFPKKILIRPSTFLVHIGNINGLIILCMEFMLNFAHCVLRLYDIHLAKKAAGLLEDIGKDKSQK